MKWVLIFMVWSVGSQPIVIPGYESEADCRAAGAALREQWAATIWPEGRPRRQRELERWRADPTRGAVFCIPGPATP